MTSVKPAAITYLQMRSPADLKPKSCADERFRVGEATVKQWQFNRFLYSLVGNDWHWTDKLSWTDQQWRDYAESEKLRTFVACFDASVAGYYELRADDFGGMEIAIFGLAPKFLNRGFGGALLTHAVQDAWRTNPTRVWLHTCDLDHPRALPNYLARGFTVEKVEQHSGG